MLELCMLAPSFGQPAFSSPFYYQVHDIGWFWYQSFAATEGPKKLHEINVSQEIAAINHITDPIQRVHAIRHLVEESKDLATLSPTSAHVIVFLELQNVISKQASYFRQQWQAVLLDAPQLNYNVDHPTSAWANLAALQSHAAADDAAIQQFAKSYGLFLFYRGTCPHCQHFAPILKMFSDHYGFQLEPVTLDGIVLPEFPNSLPDNGQAQRLNVTEVPMLFAVNPATRQVVSLGAGDRAMINCDKIC